MKKDVRLVLCLIVIVLLVLLCLFNCTAEIEDEEGMDKNPTGVVTVAPTRIISIPGKPDTNTNSNEPEISLKSIEYYTITGGGATRIDTAEALVEEHVIVTPELVADYCLDSFIDEDIELKILHVNNKDGLCTVDFNDSIFKIADENRITEVCVLDALAMSLIDNCEDVESVTFTINGRAYATDNIKIGIGNSYLSR